MAEQNMIDDVRTAKAWVDANASTLDELYQQLQVVERAYLDRTGPYASIPKLRPASVQEAIDNAQEEPGHELLNDGRAARNDGRAARPV
jgi:hypothetical protein